ncbi:MAG: hypothetical protein ACKOCB_01380 [Planctomycetia bacterium]
MSNITLTSLYSRTVVRHSRAERARLLPRGEAGFLLLLVTAMALALFA